MGRNLLYAFTAALAGCGQTTSQPPAEPEAIASGQASPVSIAVSGSDVYWTNRGDPDLDDHGAVMRASTSSGSEPAALHLARDLQETPVELVTDADFVYWTELLAVRKAALPDGPAEPLTDGHGNWFVALSADAVFFTQTDRLLEVPKQGGAASVRWIVLSIGGIAVDGQSVYVTSADAEHGHVVEISIESNDTVELANEQDRPTSIAADADGLYWLCESGVQQLVRGSEEPELLASDVSTPTRIATDDTHVFWTNEIAGTVLAVAKSGGAVTTVAAGQEQPMGIAVDERAVYWADTGSGRIMWVAK